jgi:hypothetical protein
MHWPRRGRDDMGGTRQAALVLRVLAALAAGCTLTGSLVVSCAGDPSSSGGGGTTSNAPASASLGRWAPAAQDSCSKAFHDSFFVIGPDGKKYPTWHPPEARDQATNQLCSFGHDHGMDPAFSALWADLQAHFAADTNHNGLLEAGELSASGIPFGLASEALVNSPTPRLEDHTAYKIIYANDAVRTRVSGGSGTSFDLHCDLFAAYNQPASTADAFGSNLFSVIYAVNCNSGNSVGQYPVKVIVTTMAVFGDPGSFTLDANGTQQQNAGTAVPSTSPQGGSELGRLIPSRDAVFAGVFVPNTQMSDFGTLVERWETQLHLRRPNGDELATLAPAFRVDDPARYFDNGALARSIDLCYSGLDANGNLVTDPLQAAAIVRQVRGGGAINCASVAPNGPATPTSSRVAFDDATSPFRGCRRSAFFGADAVHNSGAAIWYTDAFGANASNAAFANSIKQLIATADTDSIVLAETHAVQLTCTGSTVHVPN